MSKNVNKAKSAAKAFAKQYRLKSCDYDGLYKAATDMGYTVVLFNHLDNENDVKDLLKELKADKYAAYSKGFTYANSNYRIIFVHEDLSEYEKSLVLAHEIGHIRCEHFERSPIIGNDVIEENEASEFVHYLFEESTAKKIVNAIKRHKIVSAASFVLIAAAVCAAIIVPQAVEDSKYYGEYYIKDTVGKKFHTKDCGFAAGGRRMTVEDYESGQYEPCSRCLPDFNE